MSWLSIRLEQLRTTLASPRSVSSLLLAMSLQGTVRFLGHGTDFQQTVTSMEIEHAAVETASAGTEVGIRVFQRVREGTQVYRVSAVTQGWFERLKALLLTK